MSIEDAPPHTLGLRSDGRLDVERVHRDVLGSGQVARCIDVRLAKVDADKFCMWISCRQNAGGFAGTTSQLTVTESVSKDRSTNPVQGADVVQMYRRLLVVEARWIVDTAQGQARIVSRDARSVAASAQDDGLPIVRYPTDKRPSSADNLAVMLRKYVQYQEKVLIRARSLVS